MHRPLSRLAMLAIALVIIAACAAPGGPTGNSGEVAPAPTSAFQAPDLFGAPSAATPAPIVPASKPRAIVIDAAGPTRPFDRRLLGTNLPAWIGPHLSSPQLQAQTRALGTTMLRLPGGSWSNSYDWLACETGDGERCWWTWAARPTDFLNFARSTGIEAMWTVSINGTAKEAAALVAFFNGDVNDETLIGVDVRGRDWQTIGHWARLRAANGNPEPLQIRYWEVGNEVYGGKDGVGPECAPWGWEDVWTCNGREYMVGKRSQESYFEGFIEFRAAMQAVDPDILVGAVGVADPKSWSEWGNRVIEIGGESLDFYVVHHYGYDNPPANPRDALARPQQIWAPMLADINRAYDTLAAGRRAPVAITEYNLISFEDMDNGHLMRRAVNALYLADTIGQMAEHGVQIANQWNLANGLTQSGTDYGLLNAETGERSPAYYAMALWSRFGDELLPVSSPLPTDMALSVYAGRGPDGALTLIAVNKTDEAIILPVVVSGASGSRDLQVETLQAGDLTQTAVLFNGVASPASDLSDAPPEELGVVGEEFEHTFSPFSVTLIRLTPTAAPQP